MRVVLAVAVLVDHAWPLGFGEASLGSLSTWTHGAASSLPVLAFLALSGFFLAGGPSNLPPGRFLWHRAVRILPALWISLVVSAVVFAPLVSVVEDGSLATFQRQWPAALSYVTGNLAAAMEQYGIPELLNGVPYAGPTVGGTVFNGSLWTLKYELLCYLCLAALLVVSSRNSRPRAIAALAAGTWLVVSAWWLLHCAGGSQCPVSWRPDLPGGVTLPALGSLATEHILTFGMLFLMGMALRLHAQHIPISRGAIAAACAVLLVAMHTGWFLVLGTPVTAYLVVAAVCLVPRRLAAWGARHDYSYGIFLYAFPVQQILVLLGATAVGFAFYSATAIVVTMALAAASLRLVERPSRTWRTWSIARQRVPLVVDVREGSLDQSAESTEEPVASSSRPRTDPA